MIKKLIVLNILIICAVSLVHFNAEQLKFLFKFEFISRFINGINLLSKTDSHIIKTSFPNYIFKVKRLSIENISNPRSVNIVTSNNKFIQYVNIEFDYSNVLLYIDFYLSVLSIYQDSGMKTPINLLIEKVQLKLIIIDGIIKIEGINIKFDSIEIMFKSKILKFLNWIFRDFIIEFLNTKINFYLNKFLTLTIN